MQSVERSYHQPIMSERETLLVKLNRANDRREIFDALSEADLYLYENPSDLDMLDAREYLADRSEALCILRSFILSLLLMGTLMVFIVALNVGSWNLGAAIVVAAAIGLTLSLLSTSVMVRVRNPRRR